MAVFVQYAEKRPWIEWMEEKLWLAHYSMALCLASTMRHGIVGLYHRENVSLKSLRQGFEGR
eukprot:SAG22_NODE_1752_length_3659_cov_18.037360_1_plen_61_part_10